MQTGFCLQAIFLGWVLSILLVAGTKSRGASSQSNLANKQLQNTRRRIIQEWKSVKTNGLALELKRATSSPHNIASDDVDKNKGEAKRVEDIRLAPLPKNMFHWHFSFAGAPGTPFEGGIYHGQVILPSNYPNSPPRVQMLTPSGRFQVMHDICLSASAYHPETWQPTWTVTTLVTALRTHMLTDAHEIGGINTSIETKRRLAANSRSYRCRSCGTGHGNVFSPPQKFSSTSMSDQPITKDLLKEYIHSRERTGSDGNSLHDYLLANNFKVVQRPKPFWMSLLLAAVNKLINLTILNKHFWIVLVFFLFVRINASAVVSTS